MDILLTDEEILSQETLLKVAILAHDAMARRKDREIETPETLLAYRRIAKAQLKKAVEWLRTNEQPFSRTHGTAFVMDNEKWQALLKEVEGG